MSEDLSWSKEDMVQVSLKEPDDFLKVRETLTRIGVASKKEKTIPVMPHSSQEGAILYCTF